MSKHTIGVPGVGPYGFIGTNVPGFPTGYPLGTKWKMTDHGYVLDHSGFQHPLSPHSGKYNYFSFILSPYSTQYLLFFVCTCAI